MSKNLSFLAKYNQLLEKHPLATKIISSAVIFALGDIICQTVIEKKTFKNGFNWKRTMVMTSVGSLYTAPLLHFWYARVVKVAGLITKNPKWVPTVSTILDQTLFAPFCIASMLFLFEFIDKKDIQKSTQNVKDKLWPTIVTNWKIWPLAMLINFSIIPANYRVLFSNFIGLFWNVYISWVQNSPAK